jgi:hypothetical protein
MAVVMLGDSGGAMSDEQSRGHMQSLAHRLAGGNEKPCSGGRVSLNKWGASATAQTLKASSPSSESSFL